MPQMQLGYEYMHCLDFYDLTFQHLYLNIWLQNILCYCHLQPQL